MNLKRTIALLLAALMALSLAACGSQGAPTSSAAASSASSAVPADVEVPQEALDDVVAYLTDGAYTGDTVVAKLGDTELTAAQMLYWVAYQQYQTNYYYYSYYGTLMDMSEDMGDGTTAGEYLFSNATTTALAYAAAAQQAKDRGVALSDEDAQALANLTTDNITSYGESRWANYVEAGLINEADYTEEQKADWIQTEGERFYQHSLCYYSTNTDAYQDLLSNIYYYGALEESLFEDDGEYAPTEETMADYIQTYLTDNGLIWGRCILFSTQEAETDEEVAAVQAQAQQVYEQLSALSDEALETAFTEQQTAYDKSGYTPGEVQHYSNTDSLVDGYYDGLAALEVGQVGITDKTDYGYFILLREANKLDDIQDAVKEEYIASTYDNLVQQWIDEYGVDADGIFADLDIYAYFDKLAGLQDILTAADTIPQADTEDAEAEPDADAAASSATQSETE